MFKRTKTSEEFELKSESSEEIKEIIEELKKIKK